MRFFEVSEILSGVVLINLKTGLKVPSEISILKNKTKKERGLQIQFDFHCFFEVIPHDGFT